MGKTKKFDNLSTSYVSLSGLIRHLREQDFTGSIHVLLDQYEAEVYLNGRGAATVSEIDQATRRVMSTDGAMDRLLIHAREPGGTITVFESESVEAVDGREAPAKDSAFASSLASVSAAEDGTAEIDREDLLDVAGKLIRAVERAVGHLGGDFESSFRAARIELGDDYPFLDPTGNGLKYEDGAIIISAHPACNVLVTGLTESLRRIVDKVAAGKDGKRFRENVAIELAVAARLRSNGMGDFTPQLDRIAGTRVL